MAKIPAKQQTAIIVCFGEILLRLASRPPKLLLQETDLQVSVCGAEANVAVATAGFGHHSTIVSTLPDNDLGGAACRFLRGFGVELAIGMAPRGRMGLFFLAPGAMNRPSEIIYDRAGSALALSGPQDYAWDELLDGADWLFTSGITAALGDGPLRALRSAIAAAKAKGVKVAFDTNFRPALWRGREDEAASILRELSCEADLLFAGRRASAMMTGGTFDDPDPARAFHNAAQAMFDIAPGLSYMAATRRDVLSSDRQKITALLADRQGLSVTPTTDLDGIVDRIGTGDAFAAGVLHGLATGQSRDATIVFAAAASQWAHSVPGDALRATVADIEGLATGSGDVKR